MSREIGHRVGAILKADKDNVWLIGYGTYQGDEQPPEEIGLPFPNPKIVLDDESVVWGCECWWGEEDRIKESIAGRQIINVDMTEHRKAKT